MVLKAETPVGSRAALGAIAGFVATSAMTLFMQRVHERLPLGERYPVTPREITDVTMPASSEDATATRALLAHFLYGAGAGAVYGALMRRDEMFGGAVFGAGVWSASYLGWIPALGILKPANEHPAARNALMIGAHMLWGAATAWTLGELARSHRGSFSSGEAKDRPLSGRSSPAARLSARKVADMKRT